MNCIVSFEWYSGYFCCVFFVCNVSLFCSVFEGVDLWSLVSIVIYE